MDTPYKQYLGTNYSPTTSEARGIQLVIDGTVQELIALDSQIEIVRRQLDLLQERRSAMHDFAEQHRALLSPARKLTPDILEDIFMACLPSDRNPCMSTLEAPMLLTHICGSWRQIAMSAPRLWEAIHIVIPNIRLELYPARSEVARQLALLSDALKQRESAVSEWLGRSGVRPLSISVYEVVPSLGDDNDGITSSTFTDLQKLHLTFLVNTILPYHQQWRELDVCLAYGTLDGLIDIGLKAASLKALKSLHVTRKINFYLARRQAPKYQWKDVMALLPAHATSATFNYFQVRSSDISSIPRDIWQGLTELSLLLVEDEPWDPATSTNVAKTTVEILFCCHSLVSLTLFIECFESSLSPDSEKIILPRVRTLSIALPTSSDGVSIAKRLSLPSLVEMNIQFSSSGLEMEIMMADEIVRSLLSSGGHIRTLILCASHWMTVPNDLIQILKMVPDVKNLTISSKGIRSKWDDYIAYPASQAIVRNVVTDNLLQSLSPFGNVDSDIICPRLEEFVCDPELITGVTEHGLKNFLMARKRDQRVSNIRRVSLFINELKNERVVGEEQISLEPDSAVGFKKPKSMPMSPFEGFKFGDNLLPSPYGPIEVYTEL